MHRLVQDYLIYVALAVGVFFGTSETVLAARSTFSPKSSGHLTVTPIPESMISKIQTALRKIGIYRGPIDGRVNNETKQAVRKYQKMHGLKVNGNISKSLANLLDTGSRVDTLLKQIDRARKNNIQTACEALLNNPETKHLLKDNSDDRANPVRDSKSCFKKPTAKCLLFEAAESAKSIYKKEMRDWALGELLVAQTMAGLINEAMITTRRIHDPRLIVVALRNIAEAQAIARRDEEALAATKIIPDPLGRSEAYTAIAEIQAKHKGDGNDLILLTIKLLHSDLKKIKDPLKQLYFLTRAATALSNTGHQKKAQLYLQEASELAKHKLSARTYQTALRYIAIAFADLGLPNEALALLKEVKGKAERTPVLVRTATAQARAGKAMSAITTATDIKTLRYRAVVLSQIAESLAKQKHTVQAWRTIHLAIDAAQDIKLPFAHSFAFSGITRALTKIGAAEGKTSRAFSKAKEIIKKVRDGRLRAHGLWVITAEQRRAGTFTKAEETQHQAENETDEIKSHLSRIWMLSDVAESHLKNDEKAAARAVLKKAIKSARLITNAWERTRALAKVAVLWLTIRTNGFQTALNIP
jgi:peptidoglycan hydrolase-like protein with peptidoglycan-binding domain